MLRVATAVAQDAIDVSSTRCVVWSLGIAACWSRYLYFALLCMELCAILLWLIYLLMYFPCDSGSCMVSFILLFLLFPLVSFFFFFSFLFFSFFFCSFSALSRWSCGRIVAAGGKKLMEIHVYIWCVCIYLCSPLQILGFVIEQLFLSASFKGNCLRLESNSGCCECQKYTLSPRL
jgi:hypothetical protein